MSDHIFFDCPHCNQPLWVKQDSSKRQTTCPICKGTVEISDTGQPSKSLAVASVINAPNDSNRRNSAKDSQTNSNAGLSDIRLQIERGVLSPVKTTFRDAINDQFVIGSCLWGGIIFFICTIAANARLSPFDYGPIDFWDYAAVSGYVAVAIAVFSGGIAIALFSKCGDIRAERRNDAKLIADAVRRRAESHFATLRSLAPLLDEANRHLDEATQRFEENAFGPFWDSIQEAVLTLDAFRHSANEVRGEYDEYHHTLSGYSHTFPVLPRYGDQLPNPISALQRLDQAVRLGQTNFQFATIWEQRRTREALLAGFDTWADAVSQIAARVLSSFKAFA